jgi:hypothetical protein
MVFPEQITQSIEWLVQAVNDAGLPSFSAQSVTFETNNNKLPNQAITIWIANRLP